MAVVQHLPSTNSVVLAHCCFHHILIAILLSIAALCVDMGNRHVLVLNSTFSGKEMQCSAGIGGHFMCQQTQTYQEERFKHMQILTSSDQSKALLFIIRDINIRYAEKEW